MSEILAILGLVVFTIISSRKIIWGLGLVIILLPSYLWRLDFWGWPSTFLELIVASLFVIWVIKNFRKINWTNKPERINLIPPILRWLLIVWLLVSLISVAVNPTLAALGLWRAYFLEPLFFFLVFIYSIREKSDWKIVNYSLAALVTALFLISFYQYFTGWNLPAAYNLPNIKRLTGWYNYPNALGLILAPILAWFIGLWLSAKDKLKNIWQLIIFLLGFVVIILARSEGALVAVFVSLLFYLLFNYVYKIKKSFFWGLVILGIIILPLTPAVRNYSQQIVSPQTVPPVTSLEIRSLQWQETWELLKDNWLIGAGLAGYRQALIPYHQITWLEIYLYPHNIFLNFWVELGLLGLVIFIQFLIYIAIILQSLLKEKNSLAWPLTLMWLTWFIHGLVDVPYFKNDLSILFFLLLGMTILANTSSQFSYNLGKEVPRGRRSV